jgi:hypothetical protein
MLFPAAKDWWVACLVVSAGLAVAGLGVFALGQVAAGDVPPLPGLPVGLLLVGAGAVLLWMFFATTYEVAEWDLVCRLGPFRWRVPLDAVEEAEATDGFRLVVGLGLAWSLRMVHVRYRKPNGRRAFPVSISPRDRARFLRELARAVPGLKVVGMAEERASAD